jgi:hypothetical protein
MFVKATVSSAGEYIAVKEVPKFSSPNNAIATLFPLTHNTAAAGWLITGQVIEKL